MARVSTKEAEPIVEMDRNTRILSLMGSGATNDAVFAFFGATNPQIFEKEEQRRPYTNGKYIGYDKALAEAIRNQIRVCRHQYETSQKQLQAAIAVYGHGTVVTLKDVQPEPIRRISTGIPRLDHVWGFHEVAIGKTKYKCFGPPRSKITLLGGAKGVGKTRLLITLMCNLIYREKDSKKASHVLVEQNEVTQGEYGTWVRNYLKAANMPDWILSHIHAADHIKIKDQLKLIEELDVSTKGRLDLVVLDSIKMLKEANTEAGQFELCYAYHHTCHKLTNGGPHIIFVGHMNKAGEIKGSTAIQHYVDIVMYARKDWIKGRFTLDIPDKNRYGETGNKVPCRHDGPMSVVLKQDGDEEIESLVELYHKAAQKVRVSHPKMPRTAKTHVE